MKTVIRESRADNIVLNAQQVFYKKGFVLTSISDVCKATGCSRTTLYTYFESKENLYLAVVKKAFQKFLFPFGELIDQLTDDSGIDRVVALSLQYLGFARKSSRHYQVILDFYTILRNLTEAEFLTESQEKIKSCSLFTEVEKLAILPLNMLEAEVKNGQSDKTISNDQSAHIHLTNLWAYLKGLADVTPIVNDLNHKMRNFEIEESDIVATIRRILG